MSSHLRAVTKSTFAAHYVYVKLASLFFLHMLLMLLILLIVLMLLILLTVLMLLILLIVRGSPVISFSFRYRYVVFCLFFVSIASLYRRHLLVLRLRRFVCLLCVVPVSCFMFSLSSSWSSVSFFVSFFRSSSLFFACLRSFIFFYIVVGSCTAVLSRSRGWRSLP